MQTSGETCREIATSYSKSVGWVERSETHHLVTGATGLDGYRYAPPILRLTPGHSALLTQSDLSNGTPKTRRLLPAASYDTIPILSFYLLDAHATSEIYLGKALG